MKLGEIPLFISGTKSKTLYRIEKRQKTYMDPSLRDTLSISVRASLLKL